MRTVVTRALVGVIRVYQVTVGAWFFAGVCRFSPSCSRYAVDALQRYGPMRGLRLVAGRLLRCHPFGGSGHDPVPVEER